MKLRLWLWNICLITLQSVHIRKAVLNQPCVQQEQPFKILVCSITQSPREFKAFEYIRNFSILWTAISGIEESRGNTTSWTAKLAGFRGVSNHSRDFWRSTKLPLDSELVRLRHNFTLLYFPFYIAEHALIFSLLQGAKCGEGSSECAECLFYRSIGDRRVVASPVTA